MAITYAPKVGEVLRCDFGKFVTDDKNFNGHIPPEMRKNRMVIVLNGKLGDGCLVIPISSKQGRGSVQRGIHVHLPADLFKATGCCDDRDRWAKADTIQYVSKKRLFKLKNGHKRVDLCLQRDVVTLVQRAVIKAISAGVLLNEKIIYKC